MAAKLYIATSGYSYKGWHERFYPEDLAQKDLLPFYADHFPCVEINNSFYKIPTQKAVRHWIEQVPRGFKFCFKISRYVSHQKRLKDSASPLHRLMASISLADKNKGPLLLQLPPRMKPEFGRLDEVLANVKKAAGASRWQVAVECRDDAWYEGDDLQRLLKRHRAALVMHDKPEGRMMEDWDTARFVYMRFHGPKGDYGGRYTTARLKKAAALLAEALRNGKSVYAFMNHDRDGYAVEDADKLRRLVEGA
jgi:uncharacterized protein YecE (DUF72 family)